MDFHNLDSLKNIISSSYLNIAINSRNSFSKKLKILFEHKKIPKIGFSDNEIEILLREFANMDANNFDSFTGIGEREGRIYSNLVKNRHFNLSHGIGRSGDINSLQPKATGSSAINKLTNSLVLHLLHELGMKAFQKALIIPMATGMTLSLVMLALRSERSKATHVIWTRIDQKSCFKSILTAGFQPVIIEPILVGDELQTDVPAIARCIDSLGAASVLCVLTTTSCFAPRVPDDVIKVAEVCVAAGVPQLINNAYGLSLKRCMDVVNEACRRYGSAGVYAVVQSTDKNLMVPVGGAIVASCDPMIIDRISRTYAGRASSTPTIDVLITLLSMGTDGLTQLVRNRQMNFVYLRDALVELGHSFGLRVMETPHNPVSLAMTLTASTTNSTTSIGSQLFHKNISGARIVECAVSNPAETNIEGHIFIGFGSHTSKSTFDYINAAAAIGQTKEEIDRFITNLRSLLSKFYRQTGGAGDSIIQTTQDALL